MFDIYLDELTNNKLAFVINALQQYTVTYSDFTTTMHYNNKKSCSIVVTVHVKNFMDVLTTIYSTLKIGSKELRAYYRK